jgi:hypothetical protein
MAKAIVLCYRDVDEGATANDLILRADIAFVGAGVPNTPIIAQGPEGNGVPIAINITALAQYPNNVEDACLAEAARLGVVGLLRTDCLFPSYTRGA